MEKLIISLIENFHIIMLVIVVLCFIIPMIHTSIKRKNRKKKRYILDKKTIISDSVIGTNIYLILFHLMFFLFGLIVIYLAITSAKNIPTMVFASVFGIIMCLIPIIILLNTMKTARKVLSGKYVIILDELMDKYYYQDHSYNGENTDHSHWEFYFKDYFKKYNKYIRFENLMDGNKYNKGDKFYLVFVKGTKLPYKFASKECTLAQSEEIRLKTLDEAEEYIYFEEFVLEKEKSNEKIIVNKKRIIKDFLDKSQRQTIVFFVLSVLFLLSLLIVGFMSKFEIIGLIIILLMFICFLIMSVIKIKYLYRVINNIKKDKYEIKEDEVVSLNNGIEFRDSNKMISFKLKKYKKIVYQDKKYFADIKIGDKLYLVFVKEEKEPIKVYNAKNSVIEINEKM